MADYLNPKNTKLDANQVLIRSYDETENRLRVDAEVTATIGSVDVVIDSASGDNIAISDGTHTLEINPDGSINTNTEIVHTLDSVALGNGVDKLATITTVGPSNALDVNIVNQQDNNTNDGFGNPITSTINDISSRSLHTLTPDNVSATTTLNLLNSSVTLNVTGLASIGCQINAGTFKGKIYAEASIDGGINFVTVNFYDPVNSAIVQFLDFSVMSNPLTIMSIVPIGGVSHIRLRVFEYTSGSTTALLRASNVIGAVGSITASAFAQVNNYFVTIASNIPTLVLNSNPNRKYAYISNNSGSTVNIQFGTDVGLDAQKGLIIPPQDRYELKGDNLFTGQIYAYSASDVTISVTEGTP